MAFKALEVAKYVVDYCTQLNKSISNLKLQKMLYYLWIEYYKLTGEYLFEEDICAWPFGPVISDVYYEYCSYAGSPISKLYNGICNIITADIRPEIDNILNRYIDFTPNQLVRMTHKHGLPWDLIYQNGDGYKQVIPFELIVEKECCI